MISIAGGELRWTEEPLNTEPFNYNSRLPF